MFCFFFTVSAHTISPKNVSLEYETAVYTGKAICPAVSVKALSEGRDYFVTYTNNVSVGRAVVMVDDVNDSCPTVYKYFDILPRNISNAEIKLSYSKTVYSGKKKKPSATVTYNGAELKEGKDYTVSYGKNTKVGKAYATVKGKGNFFGEAKKIFYITPQKVKKLKTKKRTSGTVTLSWSKVNGAAEYRIYRYSKGKWKLVGKSEENTFKVSKLSSDKEYKFKVRAVCKLKDKNLYGEHSKVLKVRTKLSENDKVYVSPKGAKYHRKNCYYVRNNKQKVTYSFAKSRGCTACSRCFG
ncbi:MAG: fibronectin type III domain-containing protein [Clostridia bacterium]|nr:fibronectin type III domain-containing protein [Clostridia bacterium]